MKQLSAVLFLVLVGLFGLSFAVLNPQPVTIDYYFGASQAPLALLLALALAAGALLGAAAMAARVWAAERQVQRLKRRVAIGETEIRNLRQIPLKDAD